MKRLFVIPLGALLLAAPAWAQDGASRPDASGLGTAEKPAIPKPREALKPVPIDEELTALINDRNVLAAFIELTENARGAVTLRYSIAELRKLDQAKAARISAWFQRRGVPEDWRAAGWSVSPDGKNLLPPAEAPKAPPSKKP